jgi:NPCBM/NEW2 domain
LDFQNTLNPADDICSHSPDPRVRLKTHHLTSEALLSHSCGPTGIALNSLCVFAALSLAAADSANAAGAADVTATQLDGATVTGQLSSWNDARVVIAAPAGEKTVASDQLMSLRWPASAGPESTPAGSPGVAELTDGSLVPLSSLHVANGTASLKAKLAKDSPEISIPLPIKSLAAVRFQELDDALTKQWDEIRRVNSPNDILVIFKRDGKSLDYVEGVLGEVSDDKVEFKLDGETSRVDRAKVAGLIYFRADNAAAAEPRLVVHGRSGLRASASQAALNGAFVLITTSNGALLKWPIADLDLADFSAGKLLYLSDIDPASQTWAPLVGLPAGVTLAAEYGQPRRDHSAFNDTLTLVVKEKDAASAVPGVVRSFKKGLALRSRTELVYRLPTGFNRFTALAGIDPATATTGNVRLTILADDHPVLETEIAGDQSPQPVDVQITGAKRLKIVVDFGQNLDTGDWLNLCDAKIVK